MKKFIAVLTFTAVLCSFVSCGNDFADEVSEESSVSSVSEETTEETTEKTTTEEMATEEATTEEISTEEVTTEEVAEEETTVETTDENAEYQEVLDNFFECSVNKDIDGILKVSYPDKYCDTVKLLYEKEIIEPPCFEFLDDTTAPFKNFKLFSIDSTEPLAQDYISLFDDNYGQFQTIGEYIEQNGAENTDELTYFVSEAHNQPNTYFHVENTVKLDCMLSREPTDNCPWEDYEPLIDWEFILYYIDGEGWKIDFWLVPSMYQNEKETACQETEYIYNSAEIVLSETETESENFIVSSDSSKNYNVSSEFADNFVNGISKYYQKNDNLEYFVVVENGEISNVSGVYDGKPKSFSSFPDKYKYTEDDYIILSYEEDYQICLDKIK